MNTSSISSTELLEAILRRDRIVVTFILVIVILACWVYLLSGAGTGMYPHQMVTLIPNQMKMDTTMPDMAGGSAHNTKTDESGHWSSSDMLMSQVKWTASYAFLMFLMWWLMMIAMMLPSASPMVLMHASILRKSLASVENQGHYTPSHRLILTTSSFISGYLAMWGLFSLVAVAAQWVLVSLGVLSDMMMSTSKLLSSGLLVSAGVWQLIPFKAACLRHCRSPITFLSTHWHPGIGGAFKMGIEHGAYCLGCCWFLMALLFYGGIMNLIWIIGLALLVLAEKVIPDGVVFGRVIGLLLIAWGLWLGFTAF